MLITHQCLIGPALLMFPASAPRPSPSYLVTVQMERRPPMDVAPAPALRQCHRCLQPRVTTSLVATPTRSLTSLCVAAVINSLAQSDGVTWSLPVLVPSNGPLVREFCRPCLLCLCEELADPPCPNPAHQLGLVVPSSPATSLTCSGGECLAMVTTLRFVPVTAGYVILRIHRRDPCAR